MLLHRSEGQIAPVAGIDTALKVIETAGKRLLKNSELELLAQLRKWGPSVDLLAALKALIAQKELVEER